MEVNQNGKNEIIEEDLEIKNLLEILTQTYSATSTHKIKEAEEKLKKFDYVIINKLNKIFDLFALNKIPLSSQKALSIRIKYIFISLGKSKSLQLNELLQYIELLMNNLIDSKYIKQINISVIEQICEALKKLINNKLFKGKEDLLVKLSESIINKINIKNSFIIFSILYLIVLSPNVNINNINGIINDNFINAIKRYMMGKVDINQTIKIIDLLSLSLKKILYLGQAKYMITNIINNLFENLFRILLDYCTDENSFVSFVNNYLTDDEDYIKQKSKENLLKSKIFLSLGFMIECDKSINNDNSIQDVKLKEGLTKIIRIILSSFEYIIKEELNNIDEYYKNANYEIIIYQAFSLIIRCMSSPSLQKDFYIVAKDLVFFKIFPFLTLDLGETELFKESPDEYYLQVIDIMTEFNFKKIKTICGKCLTLICEIYPDLSFIILNIIFELLIFFMEEFDKNNLYKYTLINNEIGEFFVDNYTPESIINSCLLCISILAKQALINSELKKSLHKFLLDNQMRLENVASDKIQFKLCLLYGLFLDKLFDINIQKDKEFIKTAITFLLSIIIYSDKINEKNGLSYQSFHSMEQILENDDLKAITIELVNSNFAQQIINSIPNSHLLIYFDLINLFIEKLPVFQDNILNITNIILNKIKSDLINIKQGNNMDGIYSSFIHKEMSIIGNIVNIFNNIELENNICEFIISFIKENGDNNEFIEKIINIIVNLSKKRNKSDLVKNMLNNTDKIIIGYYNSSFYIDLPIFKLINYLILSNPKDNINILQLLNDVIINSLLKIEDNFYGQENVIYTLLLIICWLINPVQSQNNNNTINDNNDIEKIIESIVTNLLNKLNKLIENNKIEQDLDNQFLEFLYLVVIFSSFIYYSKITFNIVYDKNAFNSLINRINNIVIINKVYFSLKLNKLIIFGLSKILYENEFLKLILINFKDAFILNYNLISKQLAEETKESKMKNLINDLENNENDNVVNENDYLTKKINDIMNNNFIFPKLEYDEFEIFNTLYKKLININETKTFIDKILEEMEESTKKDFQNILLTKKINIIKDNPDDIVDEKTEETFHHRRFVKIKHN